MGSATVRGQARPRFLRSLLGEKWTLEQLAKWEADRRALAVARKEFAEVARYELGSPVADLFLQTGDDSTAEA